MGSYPDLQQLASVAREAERMAFDSVWVPDPVLNVLGPILYPHRRRTRLSSVGLD